MGSHGISQLARTSTVIKKKNLPALGDGKIKRPNPSTALVKDSYAKQPEVLKSQSKLHHFFAHDMFNSKRKLYKL